MSGSVNRAGPSPGPADRFIDGARFILDAPDRIPTVWGAGDGVLWAQGEPAMLYGGQGTGKTTLAQQLVLARAGIRPPRLLNLPVAVDLRPVLYLAGDRPTQARRSFGRMVGEQDRLALGERLIVWPGPLPFDVVKDPRALAELVTAKGAGTLIADSLKDLAVGLVDDEVGAGVNLALQHVIAAGVEVLTLHHPRKRGTQDAGRDRTIDDVYGSTWLTAGHGSVIALHGDPGDPIIELRHIKQPAAEVGPLKLLHDHDTGRTTRYEPLELAELLANAASNGLTARDAAAALWATKSPTEGQREKARRKLNDLVAAGQARRVEGAGTGPTTYLCAESRVRSREVPREGDTTASQLPHTPLTAASRTLTAAPKPPATPLRGAEGRERERPHEGRDWTPERADRLAERHLDLADRGGAW